MAPTSSSVHTRENCHSFLIRLHGLPGWRRSPRYASWASRGVGVPTATKGGHPVVGLPIVASTGISTSMLLVVLTNSRSPVSSRWLPRFNPTSRLPSLCVRLQTGARAICLQQSATVVRSQPLRCQPQRSRPERCQPQRCYASGYNFREC
jgi:hypothetical protein